MATLLILRDGFTIGQQVFKRGDAIDESMLQGSLKTAKQQRDYYGDIYYTTPERFERQALALDIEDEKKMEGVKVITANVQSLEDLKQEIDEDEDEEGEEEEAPRKKKKSSKK